MRASRDARDACYAGSPARLTLYRMRQIPLYAARPEGSSDGPAQRRLHPGAALHALRLRELRRRAAARRRRGRPLAADPLRLAGALADDGPDRVELRASSVQPDERLGDPARFDYLVVVGGLVDEIENLHPDTVRFLERAAAAGVPLVGVCTGTFACTGPG